MKIGTIVVVWRDNGEAFVTRTRDVIRILGNQKVISVEGIGGCYALENVRRAAAHHTLLLREKTTGEK